MPERDSERIPDWARKERGAVWCGLRKIRTFFGQRPDADLRSPAVVQSSLIPPLSLSTRGESNPFAYMPAEEIYKGEWLDAIRMVREYDPASEFVAVLLKQDRESAYRIGVPEAKKK